MIPVLYFSIVCIGVLLSGFFMSKPNWIKRITTFSGAFLLGTTLLVLFPEHVFHREESILGIWVLAGVLTQLLLEVLTRGLEHGHYHKETSKLDLDYLLLFFGLIIHEFLEGLPSGQGSQQYNISIIVHKLPVAIIFGILTLQSDISKAKKLALILIFALVSPLGYFVGGHLDISNPDMLMAFVSGIFLHISTTIIFESSQKHSMKLDRLFLILIGFGLSYLSSVLM